MKKEEDEFVTKNVNTQSLSGESSIPPISTLANRSNYAGVNKQNSSSTPSLGSNSDSEGRPKWHKGVVLIGWVHSNGKTGNSRRLLQQRMLQEDVVEFKPVFKSKGGKLASTFAEYAKEMTADTQTQTKPIYSGNSDKYGNISNNSNDINSTSASKNESINSNNNSNNNNNNVDVDVDDDVEIVIATLTGDTDQAMIDFMTRHKDEHDISFIEPDFIFYKEQIKDIFFPQQWHLNACTNEKECASGMYDIDALSAWGVQTGASSPVVVAVLDSGIDYNHVDIKPLMWSNPKEIPGNGIDDDGNGLVDDVYGYNFADNNGEVMDDDSDGHGTHVSSIALAMCGGSDGLACGVSWGGKIMALKCLGSDGGGRLSAFVSGIKYASDNGAKVLVNSYASPSYSSAFHTVLIYASSSVFVVAAGNSGNNIDTTPNYPAAYDPYFSNVIAVASHGPTGLISNFSNYGKNSVSVAAPGEKIIAAALKGEVRTLSGTSMACPIVAGISVLLQTEHPHATAGQVVGAIKRSARSSGFSIGPEKVTDGPVNAKASIDQLWKDTLISPTPKEHSITSNNPLNLQIYINAIEKKHGVYEDKILFVYYIRENGVNVRREEGLGVKVTVTGDDTGSHLDNKTPVNVDYTSGVISRLPSAERYSDYAVTITISFLINMLVILAGVY
eukprot:GHVR01063410.1.p1 GENE.GHVR01063410.1~~GHVR01063410.1.p1  ORF type:complete len:729 (+),score=184.37 GHVR01063410.1:175-2187(+)